MTADLRYQNGYLYEHNGAWYVRYRQQISQEDGASKLKLVSKDLGRSKDFSNIFEVERCRASFMQTVNRDRLSADSRITLTTFVEGAYLPWTKEERRASTSKGHHQVWINHFRDRVGNFGSRLSHRGCQSNVARDRQREGSYENDVATHQVGAEYHLHLCQK